MRERLGAGRLRSRTPASAPPNRPPEHRLEEERVQDQVIHGGVGSTRQSPPVQGAREPGRPHLHGKREREPHRSPREPHLAVARKPPPHRVSGGHHRWRGPERKAAPGGAGHQLLPPSKVLPPPGNRGLEALPTPARTRARGARARSRRRSTGLRSPRELEGRAAIGVEDPLRLCALRPSRTAGTGSQQRQDPQLRAKLCRRRFADPTK